MFTKPDHLRIAFSDTHDSIPLNRLNYDSHEWVASDVNVSKVGKAWWISVYNRNEIDYRGFTRVDLLKQADKITVSSMDNDKLDVLIYPIEEASILL